MCHFTRNTFRNRHGLECLSESADPKSDMLSIFLSSIESGANLALQLVVAGPLT
jgi:hypothetical protein